MPISHDFRRQLVTLALTSLGFSPAWALEPPDYVRAPDPSFRWELREEIPFPGGRAAVIDLTSQTWQGVPWRHWLYILRPDEIRHPDHALLLIAGGSNRQEPMRRLSGTSWVLADLARRTGTLTAVLTQVPNQPLFDRLKEDALIAYTFVRYLETQDASWPCLLPMVKSAMRGMDTVQAVAAKHYDIEVKKFFVTGASKRGWTTWLTGAMDSRVSAIAPMVIDTLNMSRQMQHQLAAWGAYSPQIVDYTERGLPGQLSHPAAGKLLELVDPFSYRSRLTQPKLILIGTNDPYWPVDAVNLYFSDLQGEKYLHYVPNAGHGLGPGAAEAISGFYQTVVLGRDRPRFDWAIDEVDGEAVVSIQAKDAPRRVELWTASSEDRDFRDERWEPRLLEVSGSKHVGRMKVPPKGEGYLALYAKLTYPSPLGEEYGLCTNVRVFGSKSAPAAAGGE